MNLALAAEDEYSDNPAASGASEDEATSGTPTGSATVAAKKIALGPNSIEIMLASVLLGNGLRLILIFTCGEASRSMDHN